MRNRMVCDWDVSGDCSSPHPVEIFARPEAKLQEWLDFSSVWPDSKPFLWRDQYAPPGGRHEISVTPETQHPLMLVMQTRCRKCDKCRRYRARLWAARARQEIALSKRTWFGTLTLAPSERMRVLNICRRNAHADGDDYEALPYKDQYLRQVAQISPEVTKMLKRLRKQSAFRYFFVTEAHKDGAPHFHILLHEQDDMRPLRYAQLSANWRLGFSRFKLVDDGKQAAQYCAKYISKDATSRVRASLRYGRSTGIDLINR